MPKKKTEEVAEQVAETPIPAAAPAAPRRQSSEDLLELNDQERGVTREDSEDAKWGYLAGAARRQQILTGIVSTDISLTENGMPVVPIDFEGLCVKIPVREMVLSEWPDDAPIPKDVRIQIGRMLGATIDFIPAGVDIKNRAAIGSRKAAMLMPVLSMLFCRIAAATLSQSPLPIRPLSRHRAISGKSMRTIPAEVLQAQSSKLPVSIITLPAPTRPEQVVP